MMTTLAFIFTIGILVTVHEYGHFQAARWCGVKVLKFSIGFGKPLWCKRFGDDQTEFIIAAIPLGGYVKMLGEDPFGGDELSAEQEMSRALNQQSVFKRMAIVLAGPAANLLLAILLYWILFMFGVVGMKPIIGQVAENSPAASLNISTGDIIQQVNGHDVKTWQEVRWVLLKESLKNGHVQIQTVNSRQEVLNHQLNLSFVNHDDESRDILEKLGLSMFQPQITARIGQVEKNSPADKARLQPKDLVLQVNHSKVSDWEGFVHAIRLHPNEPVAIEVLRNNEKLNLTVIPDAITENGKAVGRIGAAFSIEQAELEQYLITTHFTLAGALIKAVEKTWETAVFSLKMLWNMVLGNISWKGMSGPVTIASYAGQSANMGAKVFIGFLALISISIGVLNLLPIPILDGGHFMYYMVEFFTGKPVSETVMNIGQRLGLLILAFMMMLALYNDINRLITG